VTDDELQAITIGPRAPHDATIVLADYDPAWPAQYAREAARIRSALGARVIVLEHVGSTSVPGLAAKPRLDLVLAVADAADEAAYVPALEAAGYALRIREPAWHEHRLLKGTDPALNLHVFSAGASEVARMIAFRDWLRAHPDDRARYERTKRALAAQVWHQTQDYADAKTAVVTEIEARISAARSAT
jgi:GrpB-like predicted nucleotidyltransferase (UPF0157 family)